MRQDGFTFIEILLALALLGMLIPLCLRLETITAEHVRSTDLRTDAARLAENLMERALFQAFAGREEGEEGAFQWWIERRQDEIWVRVVWRDSGREHSLQVVTLVASP